MILHKYFISREQKPNNVVAFVQNASRVQEISVRLTPRVF